jgi:GMP synthase-like glutamine amidotransferase
MKVAILKCDEVLEKLQPEYGSYDTMIRRMFAAIDFEPEFTVYDCLHRHYPENLDRYDFYITTGSKAGVYEDIAWIDELIEFIRKLDRQQKKLIGICFGHQAMAVALGGQVEKSAKGWGVGIALNPMLLHPDWTNQPKQQLELIVSHQDQIVNLPARASILAGNDFCPYFMVQWSDHFLSVQGHPEWNTDYAKALLQERENVIPAERIQAARLSLNNTPDNLLFASWILDFVKKH